MVVWKMAAIIHCGLRNAGLVALFTPFAKELRKHDETGPPESACGQTVGQAGPRQAFLARPAQLYRESRRSGGGCRRSRQTADGCRTDIQHCPFQPFECTRPAAAETAYGRCYERFPGATTSTYNQW